MKRKKIIKDNKLKTKKVIPIVYKYAYICPACSQYTGKYAKKSDLKKSIFCQHCKKYIEETQIENLVEL